MGRLKFFDKHARPHAVFGDYDASARKPRGPTWRHHVLRLIKALGMTSDYSGADDTKETAVELWSSEESDARRLMPSWLRREADGTGLWVAAGVHLRCTVLCEDPEGARRLDSVLAD